MALFQTKPKVSSPEVSTRNSIAAKIQQRRYQILVHSLLYYELDFNIVSDSKWSEWAMELVDLQKANPDISNSVIFANAFKNFDGSTGFDLPYRDEQIIQIAHRLLKSYSGSGTEEALKALSYIRTTSSEYKDANKPTSKPVTTQRKAVKKVESTNRKKLF